MTEIESTFLIWAAGVLLAAVVGVLTWLAIRLWNKANDQTPKEIAALRTDLLLHYATKDTVLRINRELDEKLAASDRQRTLFHAENTKKLDEISLMTKAIYQHATDLGRMDERLKNLEARKEFLDDWKHLVVDPLIPRAVEDHERRLNRLEGK